MEREKRLARFVAIDGYNITLDMPNGPAVFRSTVLQPYYRDESDQDITHLVLDPMTDATSDPTQVPPPVPESILSPLPRKRGRPRDSKNKTKNQNTFFSQKKKNNMDLAIKLRNDGIIITPGVFFQESDQKKISNLVGYGVFKFELFNKNDDDRIRLYKSRMVREVKCKNDKPYEKSRLVIQGYHDNDKESILTQSPTI